MANQERINQIIHNFERTAAYGERIRDQNDESWNKYQFHEFSISPIVNGGKLVEWADYMTRLWQNDVNVCKDVDLRIEDGPRKDAQVGESKK